MKSGIFIKLFFILSLSVLYTNAINFLDIIKDRKNDREAYKKVEDIERDISFNDRPRTLDVYYNKNERITELKPVVIYIHGGTWYFGDKIKFTKLGTLVEENDYVGVIPDYVLFPKGTMEDMVYDVYSSIKWTFENIEKYGGDPKQITVVGHSAGAHLIALTLLKSYNYEKCNNITLEPLPTINKVLLLAGPYDFDDYAIFKKDALEGEIDDTIVEKFVEKLFKTKTASPYDIVRSMGDNSVKNSFNVKKFIFYYTDKDYEIPEQSAKKFMKELKRVSNDIDIQYVYTNKGYGHTAITTGIRRGDKDQIDIFLSLLQL